MRLSPGEGDTEAAQIEHLQDQLERLLQEDWKGRDADELARPLRKLRLQITVATVAYQAKMRDLQDQRRRAS